MEDINEFDFDLEVDNPINGLLPTDGTKDDHERQFMSYYNFTDEMYDIIQEEENGSNQQSHYCMDSMYEVGQSYRMVHGYISLIVCFAGILMNILIIMVLTRKEMSTPINRMLTALAIADMLVMIEYIPFSIHMYIFELPEEQQYSYSWAVFVLFHSHFTQILHTINIQLTISMSIWRYVALKCSGKSSRYLTFTRCNFCILAAYICPIIICIPNYLTFSIYHRESIYLRTPFHIIFKRKQVSHMKNFLKLCQHTGDIMRFPIDCPNIVVKKDWYTVGLSRLAKAHNELLHKFNFWIFSVFVKLIPCLVLTFFMVWLINALYKTKRRYKMLQTAVPYANGTERSVSKIRHRSENSSIMMNEMIDNPLLCLPSSGAESRRNSDNCDGSIKIKETTHNQLCPPSQQFLLTPSSHSASVNSVAISNESVSNISSVQNNNSNPNLSNNLRSLSLPNGNPTRQLPPPSSPQPTTQQPNSMPPPLVIKKKFSRRNLTRVSSLRALRKSKYKETSPEQTETSSPPPLLNHMRNNSCKKAAKRTDRTSKLLIAVLCLFLITEFPQGIMAFLSGIYGEQFFKQCYNTFAEIWDILALVNSAINFILYCFMSKQFRLQFHMLFRIGRFFKPKWINNMANCNLHQTISTTV